QRCPGLPRTACEAVHRALAKEPEERFASCGEFAAAVLAGLAPLGPEADTVRLLCPSCKNILKLPRAAAGKSGRCPRCRSAIDVATDLESLWLESEERGGGPAAQAGSMPGANGEQAGKTATNGSPELPPEPAASRRDLAAAAAALAFIGMAFGLAIGLAIPRQPRYIGTGGGTLSRSFETRMAPAEAADTSPPGTGELPAEAVRMLADGSSNDLQLGSLESLSVPAAKTLATYRGYQLLLDGLETLSAEAATALADYRGSLSLKGLKQLSPEAEATLAKRGGQLMLDGLTSLQSVDLAATLGKSPYSYRLNFPNLAEITPEAARALVTQRPYGSSYRAISVGSLRQPSAAVLSALAKGDVELPGIRTLDEAGAAALAEDDADSSLSLPDLEELSPAAAAELAKRHGFLRLGVKTLSAEAAVTLAACKGRIQLPFLTSCPPAGLEALKAMRGLLVVPPALHTSVERFLWCLTGQAKAVVLTLLVAVIGLLAAGFVLVRMLARERSVSVASLNGPKMKTALIPPIIAISILVGMSTFLGLKILPQHFKYWDDLGEVFPVGIYRGLDLMFRVLVATAIGNVAYALFVRRRLKKSLQPAWSMRRHVGTAERAFTTVLCAAWLICIGFATANCLGFFDPPFYSRRQFRLFVPWWIDTVLHGGILVVPLAGLTPLVWAAARRALRPDLAECQVYPEGIVSDAGEFFAWDRLYAYAWKPDHLELKIARDKKTRAALDKNPNVFMIGGKLRVIVPPDQREMVEAFLAERLAASKAAAKA
ncbi:MAG: hypothetical protein ACKOWG_07230, partial [Planctomycetia bacterium]